MILHDIADKYPSSNVILVNNLKASLHDTVDVSSYNLRIVVVDQGRNTGYAKAANDGAKSARDLWNPEYLVFLNDDLRFTTEWLSDCIDSLEKKKWFATTPLLKNRMERLRTWDTKCFHKARLKN